MSLKKVRTGVIATTNYFDASIRCVDSIDYSVPEFNELNLNNASNKPKYIEKSCFQITHTLTDDKVEKFANCINLLCVMKYYNTKGIFINRYILINNDVFLSTQQNIKLFLQNNNLKDEVISLIIDKVAGVKFTEIGRGMVRHRHYNYRSDFLENIYQALKKCHTISYNHNFISANTISDYIKRKNGNIYENTVNHTNDLKFANLEQFLCLLNKMQNAELPDVQLDNVRQTTESGYSRVEVSSVENIVVVQNAKTLNLAKQINDMLIFLPDLSSIQPSSIYYVIHSFLLQSQSNILGEADIHETVIERLCGICTIIRSSQHSLYDIPLNMQNNPTLKTFINKMVEVIKQIYTLNLSAKDSPTIYKNYLENLKHLIVEYNELYDTEEELIKSFTSTSMPSYSNNNTSLSLSITVIPSPSIIAVPTNTGVTAVATTRHVLPPPPPTPPTPESIKGLMGKPIQFKKGKLTSESNPQQQDLIRELQKNPVKLRPGKSRDEIIKEGKIQDYKLRFLRVCCRITPPTIGGMLEKSDIEERLSTDTRGRKHTPNFAYEEIDSIKFKNLPMNFNIHELATCIKDPDEQQIVRDDAAMLLAANILSRRPGVSPKDPK